MSSESLEVWKRSARLSANLYRELGELKDYGFRDQITRSRLSVPSNIAEGYERDSNAEFARFLCIAKGSAGEAITQIYIGIDVGYVESSAGRAWIGELKEISAMLGALIRKKRIKPQ